ncbi:2Fe-2S iron-sulfur cluster-binding protein [Sphingobium sp. TomTYG45]
MVTLQVVDRSGGERSISAIEGQSIMEVLRDNGFDDLLALCGGCCSCATCHIHIDPAYRGEFPEISNDEDDLLDSSGARDENSRLSCQLRVTAGLDGMRLRIAEQD